MQSISVIIPTYRRHSLLQRSVASALSQTVQPLEILVIDDASPDGPPPACGVLADPRVRIVARPVNGGGSAARNTGIDLAAGELVAFLDADDEWQPSKLERQCVALQLSARPRRSLCYTNVAIYNPRLPVRLWNSRGCAQDEDAGEYLLVARQAVQTSSIVLPTALAREVRFDERLRRHQDWDFVMRARSTTQIELVYVSEALVKYHELSDGANVSAQKTARHSVQWLRSGEHLFSPTAKIWFEAEHILPRLTWADRRLATSIIARALRSETYPTHRLVRKFIYEALPEPITRYLLSIRWRMRPAAV
jgi:glycosyltransferase involved in cell wall biosynthesis